MLSAVRTLLDLFADYQIITQIFFFFFFFYNRSIAIGNFFGG